MEPSSPFFWASGWLTYVAILNCNTFLTFFLLSFAGPEPNPCQNDITLQVPNPLEFPPQPPSSPSACTDLVPLGPGEGEDCPLVQSDEEEVQVDTALVTLHTDRKATPDVSDDSDSTQDI